MVLSGRLKNRFVSMNIFQSSPKINKIYRMKRKHSQVPTYGTQSESYNYCACVGSTYKT